MKNKMKLFISILLFAIVMVVPVKVGALDGGNAIIKSSVSEIKAGEAADLILSLSDFSKADTIAVSIEPQEGLILNIKGSQWLLEGISDIGSYKLGDSVWTSKNGAQDINKEVLKLNFKTSAETTGAKEYAVKYTVKVMKDGSVVKTVEAEGIVKIACEHILNMHKETPSTCTIKGNKEYYSCGYCEKIFKADKVTETTIEAESLPLAAHDYDWVIDTAAEPLKEGAKHKECTICEAVDSDSVGTVIPHIHQGSVVPAQAATCNEKGHVVYWKCNFDKCSDKYYADEAFSRLLDSIETQLDPENHIASNIVSFDAKPATCTESGNEKGTMCQGCQKILSGGQAISPINHEKADPIIENMVDSVDGKEGSYDVVVYCKYCGTNKEFSRIRNTFTKKVVEVKIEGINEPTQLEILSAITDVPSGLKEIYSSAEQIVDKLKTTAIMNNNGKFNNAREIKHEIRDIELQVKNESTGQWEKLTADNFPAAGVKITLEYISGTNGKDFDFVVTHMITEGVNAGKVEILDVEETSVGLVVTVHGLSPIVISYQKTDSQPSPTPDTPQDTNPSTPETTEPAGGDTNPTPEAAGSENTKATDNVIPEKTTSETKATEKETVEDAQETDKTTETEDTDKVKDSETDASEGIEGAEDSAAETEESVKEESTDELVEGNDSVEADGEAKVDNSPIKGIVIAVIAMILVGGAAGLGLYFKKYASK